LSHDLVVVFKGFDQQKDLQEARNIFEGIDYRGLEVPDVGFDIGAYFEAAQRVANRHLVFLNTHSEISSQDWLSALSRHGFEEGVGVAGTMGSYESLRDTVLILQEVIRRNIGVGGHHDRNVAYYFDFVLRARHRRWYSPAGDVIAPRPRRFAQLSKPASLAARLVGRPWLALRGTASIWPGAPRFDAQQFPRFPNAHVRSNAFMIRRDRWLQLAFRPRRKVDTSLFESGPQSLTVRLRSSGLAALVVGADGRGYDVGDWPRSRTFRLGDQANLLVHDNHTRAFEAMSPGARVTHAWMTWGDYLDTVPADFPDLGFSLAQGAFH
jgi:hypothetical protein